MSQRLNIFTCFGLALLFILLCFSGFAQNCPAVPSCTPQTQSYCCGYGIYQFSFGSINNSSAGGSAGYQDFTCTVPAATFTEGIGYPVSLQTSGIPQNTFIWIDLNNDGAFAASELVFTALSQVNPSGILTLPAGGILNTPLRLRIWTDQTGSGAPTGCTAPQLGQVEDYTIRLRSAAGQPVALFTADTTGLANCGGVVSFSNLSNGSNSWYWNFGDGETSTLQNPVHVYSNSVSQTYTVTLVACNAVTCDTTSRVVRLAACPKANYCQTTLSDYLNHWMKKVQLGTINAPLNEMPNWYTDLTYWGTDLIRGSSGNNFRVEVAKPNGPAFVYLIIWVDWNQDGVFSAAEKVFRSTTVPQNGVADFTGSINVPATAQLGSTRIRFALDYSANPNFDDPCSFNMRPVQDYTIRVIKPGLAPKSAFVSDAELQTRNCNRKISFTHLSATATSFQWDFGDGSVSAAPNPEHTYAAVPGNYTVRLITCNAAGCDTLIKTNHVKVDFPCLPYCIPTSNLWGEPYIFLRKAEVNGQASLTGKEPDGYGNYTAQPITQLALGAAVPLKAEAVSVISGTHLGGTHVKAWIDLDRNGNFEPSELVCNISPGVPTSTVPTPYSYPVYAYEFDSLFTMPATAQLGPTRMRLMFTLFDTGPCEGSSALETEDYTVIITGNGLAPVAGLATSPGASCNGRVRFSDQSRNGATSWRWNFGDPGSGPADTSTLQNPVHIYNAPGNYTVSLKVCNAQGCDSISQVFNYAPGLAACNPVLMPTSGALTVTSCNGAFTDPGGPGANYPNFSSGTLTIVPSGADSVTVYFDNFKLDFPDMLYVYDGPDVASPLIGQYSGLFLPNGGIITSSGGAITFRLVTDGALPEAGFEARWTCWSSSAPPKAFFTSDKTAMCTGTVQFTDRSTNQPTSRLWRFGDGSTSTQQNPIHTYVTTPGQHFFPVSLMVCNANGCDSLRYNNYVSIANPCYCPSYGTNPRSFISRFKLHDLEQMSQNEPNGYGNFTHRVVQVDAGKKYGLEIEGAGNQCMRLAVWIDLNQDHVFTANERMYVTQNTSMGSCNLVLDSLLIPGNALAGYTRMRVVMNPYNGAATACITGETGETEDYSVLVNSTTGLPKQLSFAANKLLVYPNPSAGTFQILLPEEAMKLELFNIVGQRLVSREIDRHSREAKLEIPHLPDGIYLVKVLTKNGIFSKKVILQH